MSKFKRLVAFITFKTVLCSSIISTPSGLSAAQRLNSFNEQVLVDSVETGVNMGKYAQKSGPAEEEPKPAERPNLQKEHEQKVLGMLLDGELTVRDESKSKKFFTDTVKGSKDKPKGEARLAWLENNINKLDKAYRDRVENALDRVNSGDAEQGDYVILHVALCAAQRVVERKSRTGDGSYAEAVSGLERPKETEETALPTKIEKKIPPELKSKEVESKNKEAEDAKNIEDAKKKVNHKIKETG